jgi:hypothetical protein
LALVAPPLLVTAALILLCSAALGWPLWVGVVIVAGVALVIVLSIVALAKFRGLPQRFSAMLLPAAVVVMAAVAVGTTVVMYSQWWRPQQRYQQDVRAISEQSSQLAELLTTVSPQTRSGYLDRLRPLVVEGATDELKTKILDPMPADLTQTGVVRAVGVQAVVDDAASAVVVVAPTPPPKNEAEYSDDAADIVLWFFMIRQDGQWKLKNMAPMFA